MLSKIFTFSNTDPKTALDEGTLRMINISKYLDDCLVKYSNYKPSKKNKKSYIEGNEENFKIFIQKILEFNDVYKRQKNMKKRLGDKPKKKGKYSVNDLESESPDEDASDQESERYEQKPTRANSKAKKGASVPLKGGMAKKTAINTSHAVPTRGIEITKTGLGGVQPSKFVPNRSSKTDCLNKIMQSQFMKKKKPIGLRKTDSKKEFSNEANLVARYLDINEGEESQDNSNFEPETSQLRQHQLDTNEFILRNDGFGDMQSENEDNSEQKDIGKKNLKIMIPQVTYKYIKDAMFPDSKVKDEKFLASPYPPPEFGSRDLTLDEKYFKESVSMISPMVSKKGGIFLGLNFSRRLL